MANEKSNTSTENDAARIRRWFELKKRAREEGHERQALEGLCQWFDKWDHTDLAQRLLDDLGLTRDAGRRQPRGPAFDVLGIVQAVVLLEKIGVTTPAAKKLVAERFCTTVRNVEIYVKKHGAATRQIIDLSLIDDDGLWDGIDRFRLTEEERLKLIGAVSGLTLERVRKLLAAASGLTLEEFRKLVEITLREK